MARGLLEWHDAANAEPEKVEDLPEGAPRYIQRAKGIHYTIVNGSVLLKNGAHSGVYPGKVLRSAAQC